MLAIAVQVVHFAAVQPIDGLSVGFRGCSRLFGGSRRIRLCCNRRTVAGADVNGGRRTSSDVVAIDVVIAVGDVGLLRLLKIVVIPAVDTINTIAAATAIAICLYFNCLAVVRLNIHIKDAALSWHSGRRCE